MGNERDMRRVSSLYIASKPWEGFIQLDMKGTKQVAQDAVRVRVPLSLSVQFLASGQRRFGIRLWSSAFGLFAVFTQ